MYKKLCKGGSIYIEECVAYIFFLYMAAVPVSFFSLLLLSGSIHMCANQRSKRKKKNVVSQNIFLNLLFFAKARHFDWWIVEEELALSSGQTAAADSTTSHRKFFVNTIFCDDCVIQFDEKNRLFKINAVFRIS